MLINILSAIILLIGLIFITGGVVGILRFPDFYSRLHPAGKMDTLGSLLVTMALAIYTAQSMTIDSYLTALKILLIMVFISLANPTATHAIVDAAIRAGLTPWRKGQKRR